jgi:CRISPR-associated exonuclease Cas4
MELSTDPNDNLLMLSGIQHIAFCERQWALIHIEQQWAENVQTVEGHHLHAKVDDPMESDRRGDIIALRSVSLTSYTLGLYGRADVVELIKSTGDETENTIVINEKPGRWKVTPVEYKRGKPKTDERDEVQLCAQAMCLEEMYGIHLEGGFLYYGETRHRHDVEFSEQLRTLVTKFAKRMHELFENGQTPPPVYKPHCRSCSLLDVCLPKSSVGLQSVEEYLKTIFAGYNESPSD